MVELPKLTTPKTLSEAIGCPERTLRQIARRHGCCRVFGNTMLFTDDDIAELLEAVRLKPAAPRTAPVRKVRPQIVPVPVPLAKGARTTTKEKPAIVPIPYRKDR